MSAAKSRSPGAVAVSCLVHALDKIAGLLKFYGEEEGTRCVSALAINARSITDAIRDLLNPEVEAALIWKAAKEVNVLLVDEEIGVVDRNDRSRAGSQPERLYFNVAVVKI